MLLIPFVNQELSPFKDQLDSINDAMKKEQLKQSTDTPNPALQCQAQADIQMSVMVQGVIAPCGASTQLRDGEDPTIVYASINQKHISDSARGGTF